MPFSINAQTEADIQRANAQTLEDISRNVAGLTVQNLGPGQSQVSVRGVSAGQIVRDQPGVKEQVGVYLDESVASLSLFTPDFDLYDLNRVETLRGPQGTLFGSGSRRRHASATSPISRSSTIRKARPRATSTSSKDGGVGYGLKGAINLPLGDTAAMRVVGYGTHFGGFIDSVGPFDKKNVNSGSRIGGRASLLWQPTPELKITPRIVYQKIGGRRLQPRRPLQPLRQSVHDRRSRHDLGKRKQYLLFREKFSDKTTACRPRREL